MLPDDRLVWKAMIRHSQQQIGLMEALDVALDRLLRGADIDECLSLYPHLAVELEPLLRTAGMVRAEVTQPLPPEMERWLATRAQEFAEIADQMLTHRHARRNLLKPLRKAAVQRVLVGALAVTVLLASVDMASAQSLPGDSLYVWKVAREDLTLSMTSDPVQRSKLHVTYARRRLLEINEMLASNAAIDPQALKEPLALLSSHIRGAVIESRDMDVVDVSVDVTALLGEVQTAVSQLASKAPNASPLLENVKEQIDSVIEATASRVPLATASPVPSLPPTTPVESPTTVEVTASETVPQIEREPERVGAAIPIATPLPTVRQPLPSPTPDQIEPTAISAPAPTVLSIPFSPTALLPSSPTMMPTAPSTETLPTDVPLPTDTPSPTATVLPTATHVSPTEPTLVGSTPQPPTTHPPRPTATLHPTITPTSAPTDTPPATLTPPVTPTDAPPATLTPPVTPTDAPPATLAPPVTPTDTPPATLAPPVTPTDTPPATLAPPVTPMPAPNATPTAMLPPTMLVTPTEEARQPTVTPTGSETSGIPASTPDVSGARGANL